MRFSKVLFVACLVLCSLVASAATPDTDRLWTTVGSAGTLDEKSEGKVIFERAVVQKGQSLVISQARQPRSEGSGGVDVTDSAVIRYNVTAVDGLFNDHMIGMMVRFRDEGLSAQVVARLIQVNLDTGDETTLVTFDSDNSPQSMGYHVDSAFSECSKPDPFDFVKNAYYIEATLTTSSIAAESLAGIEMIQLLTFPCPG